VASTPLLWRCPRVHDVNTAPGGHSCAYGGEGASRVAVRRQIRHPEQVGSNDKPRVTGALTPSAGALRAGLALSGLDVRALWVSYLGLGGTMSLGEVVDTFRGLREVSAHEHDMLAQALNDHFTAHGHDHPVAYATELTPPIPSPPLKGSPGPTR